MQKFYSILVALFCVGLVWSTGYKDFSWGMTAAELEESLSGLQKNSTALAVVPVDEMYALSKQLFGNLIKFELSQAAQEFYPQTQKYSSFFSREEGLVFYFADEQLICVGVDFGGKNPYKELAQKYGTVNKFYFLRANTHTYEGLLWNTPERVIFYSAYRLKPEYGTIYYFDPSWLASLKNSEALSENNSRVD